ncbi:MAG: DMT family transporter [Gammaproteobacteria bacterium]|nr:DMT family transporter [Gammaproteobacteria bacterium]
MSHRTPLIPLLGLLLAMMLWGSSFIALKLAFMAYNPWLVIFGRLAVATLCFAPFVKILFRDARFERSHLKYLIGLVLAEPGLYFILEALALENTSASQAGMITAMLPLIVAIGAGLWLGERVSAHMWVGFSIAIIGAGWLSLAAESTTNAPNPMLGNFLEFLAMICAAGYTILLKKLVRDYSPLALTAIQAAGGTLFFLPALFLPSVDLQPGWDFSALGAVIYLGTFVTIGAYGLYNYGLSHMPASHVGGYINLIPVFAVILGFLVLGDHFNLSQLFAIALVFTGVIISQWQPATKEITGLQF